MPKKLRVLFLPIMILAVIFAMSACSTVKTETIEVDKDKAFKTAYFTGEEFNAEGLHLIVSYSDGNKERVKFTDIRQEASITGFSTQQEGNFMATIHYRNKTALFAYTVMAEADSQIKFTVTFESDGGSEVESQEVSLYGSVSVPASPMKDGYQFDGWYKEKTLINPWDFATEKVTQNTTLYAKWAKLYTVTFTSPESGEPDIIRKVKAGGDLSDVPQVPEIPGMTGRWDRNSFSNIRSDLSVKAVYSLRTFYVGFYDTDAENNSITLLTFEEVPYGTQIFKEEPYKTKIGEMREPANAAHKHFVGWSEDEELRVTEGLRIYARYETDEHTVSFYQNAGVTGEIAAPKQTVAYGTPAVKPEDPEREGYAFGGWYKESDCRREWVFRNERVMEDTMLFAKWIRVYTIKFVADGTEIPEYELKVLEGATLTADQIPEVPAKTGYLGAWDRTEFIAVNSDDTVTAVYTVQTFTVEFRAQGAAIPVDGQTAQTVEYGKAAVIPTEIPAMEGYSFSGWDKEESVYTRVTADLIVNAVYTANSYQVTYWSRLINGPIWEPISVQYGSPLSEPIAPQQHKYIFAGWYLEDTFETKWDFGVNVVKEDVTLYAYYITLYYVDFYDFDGALMKHLELRALSIVDNEEIPAPPERPGKSVAWFDNRTGMQLDLRGPISSDYSFRPRETGEREYVITYTVNGVVIATYSASYGETVAIPDNPTPDGMNFVGWRPSPEGMTVTDDLTFEAELSPKQYRVLFVADDYQEGNERQIFADLQVRHGGVAYPPTENPERWENKEGHQFIGWDQPYTNVTSDMIIKAAYRAKVFTVSFQDKETNETYYSYEVEYGTGVATYPSDMEPPYKRGFRFMGWDDNYGYTVRSDMIIYAVFERMQYNIVFETAGGSTVETLQIPYQGVLSRPEDPVFEGKAFLGWFTDENRSVKYTFGQQIDADLTLYAGWADYVEGSEGVAYALNTMRTGYEVVYSDTAYNKSHIVIQNYINELPVVGIGYGAFRGFENLVSITIPDTVEYISPNAFKGCVNLKSSTENGQEFVLPMGVARIGANAFENASALKKFVFAEHSALETIGDYAFAECLALSEIVLPEGTREVGKGAFSDCGALRTAVIPASMELLRTESFARNKELKYLSFLKDVPPNLEQGAFAGAPESFHIYVPDLDEYRNVNVSAGWKEVSDRLYSNYYFTMDGEWAYTRMETGGVRRMNLVQYLGTETNVTVPQTLQGAAGNWLNVAMVDAYAFDSGVTAVTVCSDVALHENAFSGAVNLEYLGLLIEQTIYGELSTVLRRAFTELPYLTTLGVTGGTLIQPVSLRTLFGNSAPPAGLEKVCVISGGGNLISERMFENCNTLKEVEIAADIVSIKQNAFRGAAALEKITFLADEAGNYGLTEIGDGAFDGCVSLQNLNVPASVQTVGQDAFRRTQWLETYAESHGGSPYVVVGDGILYMYLGNEAALRIPDEVKSVREFAFYHQSKIRGVVFGENSRLEIIRESAFESAVNLEYVVLPASLQTVERRAFCNAEKLVKMMVFGGVSVTFGEQATQGTAADGTLYVYAGHQELHLADGVEVRSYYLEFGTGDYADWIVSEGPSGWEAIQYIGSDTEVRVAEDAAVIHHYAFHRGVTYLEIPVAATLEQNTFGGVTKLTEMKLYETGVVPAFNGAVFAGAFAKNPDLHTLTVGGRLNLYALLGGVQTGLTTVFVADGTQSLAEGMFRGFTALSEIVLPASVTAIGANAFENTAWLDAQTEEYVVVLDGILVAYKGEERVITLPQNIKRVNDGVFRDSESLGFLIVDHVMEIGKDAFRDARNLNIIWMKEGAMPESVGANAFDCGAEGRVLYVPAGMRSQAGAWWTGDISEEALLYANRDGEEGIALVTLTGEVNAVTGNRNARLVRYLKKDGVAPLHLTEMETAQGSVTVTEIGNNALLRDTVNVILPLESVVWAEYAFYNLADLQILELRDTQNGTLDAGTAEYLFRKNPGLQTVVYAGDQKLSLVLAGAKDAVRTVKISDGAARLTDFALEGFGGVTDVVIPESVTDAGTYALEETAWYQNSGSFIVFPSGLLYKYKGNLLRNPSVPTTVNTVGKYAFSRYQKSTDTWTGDSSIEEIQFNAGSRAKTILPYAFYGLSSLRYVDIPDSMWDISPLAFEGTQIHADLNGMLTVRGRYSQSAIVQYTGTQSVITIPGTVSKITARAFAGNTAITEVTFAETTLNKVTVCDGAFENCTNLTKVGWHAKVTEIGAGAFTGTAWLNNQTAEAVTVNGILLAYLGGLDYWEIPTFIQSVTADALPDTLKTVVFASELPPVLADGALDRAEAVLVPAVALEIYRTHYPQYADKMAAI